MSDKKQEKRETKQKRRLEVVGKESGVSFQSDREFIKYEKRVAEEDAKIEELLLKCDREAQEHAAIFELDDKINEAKWFSDK
jgi:hypothetical protein